MFNQGGEEMGEKVKITADWELMAYSHWEKKNYWNIKDTMNKDGFWKLTYF